MSERRGARESGLSFLSLLTIVFVVLKLTNHIAWPWVWVLAPIWIPIAGALFVVVSIFVFGSVMAMFERLWRD